MGHAAAGACLVAAVATLVLRARTYGQGEVVWWERERVGPGVTVYLRDSVWLQSSGGRLHGNVCLQRENGRSPPSGADGKFVRKRVGGLVVGFVWDVERSWLDKRVGLGARYNPRAPHGQWSLEFMAPHWLVAGVLTAWPIVRACRVWRRCHRRAEGLCRQCGYDLRATPDRCPECGGIPGRERSI